MTAPAALTAAERSAADDMMRACRTVMGATSKTAKSARTGLRQAANRLEAAATRGEARALGARITASVTMLSSAPLRADERNVVHDVWSELVRLMAPGEAR